MALLSKIPGAYIHNWSYKSRAVDTSIARNLHARDIDGKRSGRSAISHWSIGILPPLLREHEHIFPEMDKIFASRWLSHNEIVIGSKDCKLFIINIDTNKRFEILLDNGGSSSTIANASTHPPKHHDAYQEHERQLYQDPGANCAGVRSIAINPSKTLLAVGMGNPEGGEVSITVYRLPSFEPCALLNGHTDTVFAVDWLDDNRLISGGRDTTVKIWDVSSTPLGRFMTPIDHQLITIHDPVEDQPDGRGRVRDLRYNLHVRQAVTLSTEGCVRIWDVDPIQSTLTIPLRHAEEAVCMASSVDTANLYAVGSQSHVSLIDPRVNPSNAIVHVARSLDDGWGVRSLSIQGPVITVGGGLGRISFYDLRAQDYISCDSISPSAKSLEIGTGWLKHNNVYLQHFASLPVRNAIYTLGYDDAHLKLFTAGGPLQLGLCGSYAGLWW